MRSWLKGAKSKELRAKSKDAGRDARAPGALCPTPYALCSKLYALCSVLFRGTGILLVMVMAVLILCFTALTAAEAAKTTFYDYSAKEMTFDRKTGVTVFEGDAKLEVRDSDDYLNADKITIYRDVKTGELIRMEAVGNVDMKEQDMTATCERAIFYETEDRIELEGSEDSPAVVDDGKNRMEAPAITYFRKEDRLEARGNVSGHVTITAKEGEAAEEEAEEKGEK